MQWPLASKAPTSRQTAEHELGGNRNTRHACRNSLQILARREEETPMTCLRKSLEVKRLEKIKWRGTLAASLMASSERLVAEPITQPSTK